jgi:hypothetical protein
LGSRVWSRAIDYPNENLICNITVKLILYVYYVIRFSANKQEVILNIIRAITFFIAEVLIIFYD